MVNYKDINEAINQLRDGKYIIADEVVSTNDYILLKKDDSNGISIGNVLGVIRKKEIAIKDLEDSIKGISQIKPILQEIVKKMNGKNTKQGIRDSEELGIHFDTALKSMKILLSNK